ncbi:MAG: heat-inducible transcriptional repressor HrcA [Actinobacteria bacterium]|nr:heat-inducible transcriptional repressor HrcA [Actinomycetota bacterium]MCI0678886.1 heat-inducible transcriptional repressor HrcA [Actinomycetota bacterium]
MLEDRRSEVLRVLVEEHIRTGEPVSSKTIAELSRLAVSPATIRNDLASLEHEGYAVQPHTSAGRVPTAAAYRYYVDHLGPGQLRRPAQDRISALFGKVHLELSKLLRATTDLLAEITDLPAVVVAPGVARDKVRSLHTVQITTDQILLVVVTEGGRVVQQRGRVRAPVTPFEIETGQRIMASAVVGTELGLGAMPPRDLIEDLDDPTRELVLTIYDCLHLAATAGSEMFIGGTERTASLWHDPESAQRVLDILQREAEVMKLLAGVSGVSIQIGSEMEDSSVDMAVVSSSYDVSGEVGSVGVIGPMRMNYKRAISAVEEVSRELEDQIGSQPG